MCRTAILTVPTSLSEFTPDGPRLDHEATSYADWAMREAMEAGFMSAELSALLQGASVVDIVPPSPGEDLRAYAERATSELMTRYLAQDALEPPASD